MDLFKKDNNEKNIDNILNINLKSEDDFDEDEPEDIQDIKQMGVPNMPQQAIKDIQCITIIGEIEGHFAGNPQKKST